jgi:CRP-like cAMP-binding protein
MVISLKNSQLFKNIDQTEVEDMIKSFPIKKYAKNSYIANEGDDCSGLGVIISGKIEVLNIFPSGKSITITHFEKNHIFGEAILFSKSHKYPVDLLAKSDCEVLFINKKSLMNMMKRNPEIMSNYMTLLSERLLMMNKKIRVLSLDTIRKKVCNFLISEYKKQKSNYLEIGVSKKEMAERMGVQRPSLSRELIKMQSDGLIEMDKNIIKIFDIEDIEGELI